MLLDSNRNPLPSGMGRFKAKIFCPVKLKAVYPCNLSAPCLDAIMQLDMLEAQFHEAVGCKRLTRKEWDTGLKKSKDNSFMDNIQINCPLLKDLPNDPEIFSKDDV